jgi:hypothetical protein
MDGIGPAAVRPVTLLARLVLLASASTDTSTVVLVPHTGTDTSTSTVAPVPVLTERLSVGMPVVSR